MMLSADNSQESAKAPRLTSSGSVPSSNSLMSGFTARDTFRRTQQEERGQDGYFLVVSRYRKIYADEFVVFRVFARKMT